MKKLIILLMAVVLIAGLLAGCGIIPESKLDKIEVDSDSVMWWCIYFGVGENVQLEVTAFYDDGTSADVTLECEYTYKSEALTQVVATVSDEGLLTGIQKGKATIIVTYTQHNFWTHDITRICEVDIQVQ